MTKATCPVGPRFTPLVIALLAGLFLAGGLPCVARAITLDEALRRAVGSSYPLEEQKEVVKRSEYSYMTTIDPYLPRLDLSAYYNRSLSSNANLTSATEVQLAQSSNLKDNFGVTGTISWRFFDGGERSAKRKGAYSFLEREKERFKGIKEDILFNIKFAFYTALGKRFIVEKKQEALDVNRRIYDLTRGRYDEGVAKKSDVLQAEVRLATARIDLNEAAKEYEKSLEEVKSLLTLEDKSSEEVEGILEEPEFAVTPEKLVDRAFRLKPEIILQTKEVERLASVRDERKSAWYPRIDLQLQQTRQDKRFFPDGRSDAFIVNFTFPLFDGVGRYYNVVGAERDIAAAKYRLEETKRLAKLGIIQAYKDYELGKENVSMFRELVRDATVSFDQAFGEYKVGKGDVLTVLSSERDLAKAKENFVSAVYKANTARAGLERAAYLGSEGY